MKNVSKIIWFPIWFFLGFILFNYFFVTTLELALTSQAEEMLLGNQGEFWAASSLFIFPNILLSFLLWTYSKNYPDSSPNALWTLCITAIACGFIPQVLIYLFYYTIWFEGGAHLAVVMFGFPFIYMVGVMVGWVMGLMFTSPSR